MVTGHKSRWIKVAIATLIAATFFISLFGVLSANRNDAKRLKGYENAALAVGLDRARQECQKEGLKQDVCGDITGVVSTSNCGDRICWIVYARSGDPHGYAASFTISKQGNSENYVIIDYLRDTGTRH